MRDPRTEAVLNSLRVKFEYQPELAMSKPFVEPSTQVRLDVNRATAPEVKRYTDLLKAGAEFPPICIMKDGRVIDGNTRLHAFNNQRRSTIPAYICDITSPSLAKRIGVELNSVHGKRMEKEELVLWIGENGVGDEDIARITGWSSTTVARTRGALLFDSRRRQMGIDLISVLPDTAKQALARVTLNEPFRALTALADEAGLKAREIAALAKQVNEAPTEAEALHIVSDFRHESAPRIEEHKAGLRASTPLYQQLRMHAGWLIKQGSTGLYDANPYTGPKSRAVLEDLREVIAQALERYI